MVKLSGPMLAPRSGGAPKQIVVLLHGYGADGGDLIGLGQHWADVLPDALFVAPNAPNPCGQNPFGFEWFPLANDRSLSWADGARSAAPVIVEFLSDLWAQSGLSAKDTVLVGFSQGSMMALHVGTVMPGPLAGIVAFSGAFIPAEAFPAADKARSCWFTGIRTASSTRPRACERQRNCAPQDIRSTCTFRKAWRTV